MWPLGITATVPPFRPWKMQPGRATDTIVAAKIKRSFFIVCTPSLELHVTSRAGSDTPPIL